MRITSVSGSIPACTGEPWFCHSILLCETVYPRVYGGTSKVRFPILIPGLSPRVRGNLLFALIVTATLRSIPACTGEPWQLPVPAYAPGVYPRVYGGTLAASCACLRSRGLSPRVRGNQPVLQPHLGNPRSIPACTGEPKSLFARALRRRVYPRVYGGTSPQRRRADRWWGLSPRVRGNPAIPDASTGNTGSIPACTGEPKRGQVG